jgi:hypothetical protein
MTSTTSAYAQTKEQLSKFLTVDGPQFNNLAGVSNLFPFIYSNNTLDLNFNIYGFKPAMVDIPNKPPAIRYRFLVKNMGGTGRVLKIGPSFEQYIRSWFSAPNSIIIPLNATIDIYINGTVMKVQSSSRDVLTVTDTYAITTVPPTSDGYTYGYEDTNYITSWIFKTPLTITFIDASGIRRYITFRSVFGDDSNPS